MYANSMFVKVKTYLLNSIKKRPLRWGLGLSFFAFWLFCLPSNLFSDPTSTVVTSRDGQLLGARIAPDGQWRFPAVARVPEKFETCLLFFEDEYFYNHPGFNPVAITKAIWNNLTTNTRRGASTITQQVIRLSRKNQKRSYWEKAIELVQATRLEARFSKREILNLYASHAPFGGNVVGLETAAWRYYGIPAQELSWGQAATLAVLPNAPALIYPGKGQTALKAKRDRLLSKLLDNKKIDRLTYQLAIQEPLPGQPLDLPQLAPHFVQRVVQEHPGQYVNSSLDFNLQQRLNQIVAVHHKNLSENQINNAAVLVLNVNTLEVIGYVGNTPTHKEHQFAVDIISKGRSTGSILKPLLFSSALGSGELLPNMLVDDLPTVINGYNPTNYNGNFDGIVPASQALSRSLNIPAVRLLSSYGLERFAHKIEGLNIRHINKTANHYGLSLILGGAEGSLWDITKSYANMAGVLNFYTQSSSEYRENAYREPSYLANQTQPSFNITREPELFSAGSIYSTFKALQDVNRPFGQEQWDSFQGAQPIAWKTGTSYGFKDAWAVGVTPQYAIGIWVGNADGEGRPGLTGIQAAAPILFDVLDILPKSGWFEQPYDDMVQLELCTASGYLAGQHCKTVTLAWVPKAVHKTGNCPYHKTVHLDALAQYQVNSSCYPASQIHTQSWFELPPAQAFYYSKIHPEYKSLPPFALNCLPSESKPMEFIFPKQNQAIVLAKDFNTQTNQVIFKVAHTQDDSSLYWYLDDSFIGVTTDFHELAILPERGEYLLTVMDQEGAEIKQRIRIE